MRLALALGVAFGALTLSAYAQPAQRVFIRAAPSATIDADGDGYITRAEMTAAADRLFTEMDRNNDGRLNETDHPPMEDLDVSVETSDGERIVRVIRNGEEIHSERRTERRRTSDGRDVIIMRGGHGEGPPEHGPMIAPLPPHPPMLMFASNNIEEFDRDGDGALSLEEFRAQQLAQFDAQDGNRDGRIRAIRRPEPPEAPEPPAPPRRR